MIEEFYLKMAIVTPGAKPFEPGRDEDAGWDIWALNAVQIPPLCSAVLDIGIATEFPKGYVGFVMDRSGAGFKGSMRRAGVIDSGYRDPWRCCLFNSSTSILIVESVLENPKAKAAAQVVFLQYFKKPPQIVDYSQLAKSERGTSGFGASDHVRISP